MTIRRIVYISAFVSGLSATLTSFVTWGLLPSNLSSFNLDAAQQSDSERLQELRTLIDKEIGTPSANNPTQCKLIAFGSKPCGRPTRYLVYSTARTNEARLEQLVNKFNQLEKKMNEERKILSDCMFVTEPSVEFVGGACAQSRPIEHETRRGTAPNKRLETDLWTRSQTSRALTTQPSTLGNKERL